jgi:hypothetical protein
VALQLSTEPYSAAEVARGLSLSAGYVGTLSHRLAFSPDINYPIFTSTATSSNYNNRRPILPGVLSSINLMQSNQTASYNSLQVTAKRSMSRDLGFNVFYTFSKSLCAAEMAGQSTNGAAQDFNNMTLEHGRSTYDQRHNFIAVIIWNLNYYNGSSGVLKAVLNRWTLSPVITLTSGLPFTVLSGRDNNYDGNNTDRANLVGNPYLDPDRPRSAVISQWFKTAAFAQNTIGTDGNSARNLLETSVSECGLGHIS